MDNQTQPEYSGNQNRDSNLHQLSYNFQNVTLTPENEERLGNNPDLLTQQNQNFVNHVNSNEHTDEVHGSQQIHQQPNEGKPIFAHPSYAQLPLKSAKVLFPQLKEAMVNSYMVYKINFVWNDKEFEVGRRFSDFKQLRKAIKNYLPFTYVFPMHRKQMIVS